jgi:long-chain acyl-CoA synthetase
VSVHAEEIEAHYCKSSFIKEVCVIELHAVVVPNMELIRRRKIVNVGDLLRFELEGLSEMLPPGRRARDYEIWFEPLPRTTSDQIDRDEVERRTRERQRTAALPLTDAERVWLDEPHAAAVVKLILVHAKGGVRIRPDANLEIDLGLDSLQRVELLTELEQRFGVKFTNAAEIYTVRQLVDALRAIDKPKGLSPQESGGSRQESGGSPQDAGGTRWGAILLELPRIDRLLRRPALTAAWVWVAMRIIRMAFARVRVTGLDKLPASGPYIITPNHQSYIDPFIVCGVLPYRVFKDVFYVGAVEYFEGRLGRWVAQVANLLPVDPDSNLVPAMRACAFGLTHGKILVLFPEGERSLDGGVKKFKKGAPILAQHLGVPVVPVALKGIYEVWPRNYRVNWRLVAPWSGHRVTIEFGEPMTFPADANYNDSALRLRTRVNEMWEALST